MLIFIYFIRLLIIINKCIFVLKINLIEYIKKLSAIEKQKKKKSNKKKGVRMAWAGVAAAGVGWGGGAGEGRRVV